MLPGAGNDVDERHITERDARRPSDGARRTRRTPHAGLSSVSKACSRLIGCRTSQNPSHASIAQ